MADGWRLLHSDPATARLIIDALGARGDQLQAALDEQFSTLSTALRREVSAGDLLPTKAPDWVKAALRAWDSGGRRDCKHLRASKGPMPIWMVAWDPSRLCCTDCMALLQAVTAGTTEDDTCDACRRVFPILTPVAVTCGNLVVLGGLCDGCEAWQLAHLEGDSGNHTQG